MSRYLGFWVIVITVQVLGKYMMIRYLDPQGLGIRDHGLGVVGFRGSGSGL